MSDHYYSEERLAQWNSIGDTANEFSDIWKEALESGKLEDDWDRDKMANQGTTMVVEGLSKYLTMLREEGVDVDQFANQLELWLQGDCDPLELEDFVMDLRKYVLQLGEGE